MFSLAEVSKNSRPKESASCFPRSNEITRSSSMSHLFPTRMTCALSHEYVLICVHLKQTACQPISTVWPSLRPETKVRKRTIKIIFSWSWWWKGRIKSKYLPVVNTTEWFLICHVVHKNETHGASVICRGYGSVSFLAGGILEKKIMNRWQPVNLSHPDSNTEMNH